MSYAGELAVKVYYDTSDGIQKIQSNSAIAGKSSGSAFGSAFKKAFFAIGTAVVALQAVDFLKESITAASDMNETMSKTHQIFGTAAAAVIDYSKNSSDAIGQSQQAALDAAGTFATFGKSAGLAGKDLSSFSTDAVTLSSDLASFYNTSPEDAVTAIGSAMRGEYESIRKYGVLINDDALKQEALRQGIIKNTTEALTPQQKVLAANALIYKQTSDAQGDFERTSGGLANQQRILAAKLEDSKAKLGEAFLPVALAVVEALNKYVVPAFEKVIEVVKAISSLLQGDFNKQVAKTFGVTEDSPIIQTFFKIRDKVVEIIDKIKEAFGKLFKGDFAGAISSLFGGGKGKKGNELAGDLETIGNSIKDIVTDWGPRLKDLWDELWPKIQEVWKTIQDDVIPAFADWYATMIPIYREFVEKIWPVLKEVILAVVDVVSGIIKIISGIVTFLTGVLSGDWGKAWDGIMKILEGVGQVIWGIFHKLIENLWKFAKEKSQEMRDWLKAKLLQMWEDFKSTWKDKMLAIVRWVGRQMVKVVRWAFNKIKDWIKQKLTDIRDKLVEWKDWVVEKWHELWDRVQELAGNAWDWLKLKIAEGLTKLRELWDRFKTWLAEKVRAIWENVKTTFREKIAQVVQFVRDIPGKIVNALGELGELLLQSGKDIIQGLIDGILSMGSTLGNAVKDTVLDHIPGPVADILNLGSPSKLMRQYGRWTGEGLALGITDSQKSINKAAAGMAPKVPGGVKYGVGGAPFYGGVSGGDGAEIRVFIGDRELTDIVRVETKRENAKAGHAYRHRRN